MQSISICALGLFSSTLHLKQNDGDEVEVQTVTFSIKCFMACAVYGSMMDKVFEKEKIVKSEKSQKVFGFVNGMMLI